MRLALVAAFAAVVVSALGAREAGAAGCQPNGLTVASQPSGAIVNQDFSLTVHVTKDGTLQSCSGTMTIAAYTNSSCTTSASGSLTGSSVTISSGVGSFTAANYDTLGTIYLKADNGTYNVCTAAIAVQNAATKIAFTGQPVAGAAALPPVCTGGPAAT